MTYTAEQIEAIGGRRWAKAGKDRVYISTDIWVPMIGLDVATYKTGNISSATLNGEPISNTRANEIITCVEKVYWDSTDGKIHVLVSQFGRYSKKTPAWIHEAIAAAVANLDKHDDQDGTTDTDEAGAPAASRPDPAALITALRAAGNTVRQIAALVGVSASTIYRWARGICRPLPTNAAALAALA